MKRKRKRKRKVVFPLHVDPAILPRLDRIAETYRRLLPGARITRADACRSAINVGLDAIEGQLRLGGADEGAPSDVVSGARQGYCPER